MEISDYEFYRVTGTINVRISSLDQYYNETGEYFMFEAQIKPISMIGVDLKSFNEKYLGLGSTIRNETEESRCSDITIGDTVVLKSGGPIMTVTGFIKSGGDAICKWIERRGGENQVKEDYFPLCALRYETPRKGFFQ